MKIYYRCFTSLSLSLITTLFITIFYSNSLKAQPQLSFTPLIQGLIKPVEIKNAADKSGRLFIVQQNGIIKIYKNNALVDKPFLDISSMVSFKYLEGMWSVAFSPNYKKDRMFFVLFVDINENTILARFQTSKTNPDSAIVNSGVILISIPRTTVAGPYLGQLQFGKDGYLYISMSDGSFYDKITNYAQDGQLLQGKMLRLNINTIGAPYFSIPPDNPFVTDSLIRDEIWSLGFRNAWRWSFDRGTSNMYIADVGNDTWEELNILKTTKSKAANFGWKCYEGTTRFSSIGCGAKRNYLFPSFTYPHDSTTGGWAIIGGYVYRGTVYPQLNGYYICSDHISNNAWKIKVNTSGAIEVYQQSGIPPLINGYGEAENGELYAASLQGIVYSIGVAAPIVQQSPPLENKIETATIKTTINAKP